MFVIWMFGNGNIQYYQDPKEIKRGIQITVLYVFFFTFFRSCLLPRVLM